MKNMMEINGYRAIIQFDPDIDMFRGEFVGLNGGADFYARDIASLKAEGEASLKVFLAMCREDGVEPGKQYSGKFNVRISPELHATIAAAAAADGKSLNQWIADELRHAVADGTIRNTTVGRLHSFKLEILRGQVARLFHGVKR